MKLKIEMKQKQLHEQIMKIVNQLIKEKISKEPVQAIILGGSVARGDETKYSDIDIVFYVKKKDMPIDFQRFYKFKGKYIEEHYLPIENLKPKDILPEEKVLFNITNKKIKPSFNEKWAKKVFSEDLALSKKFQKLAEREVSKEDYDKSFNYLYGIKSPSFLMMHTIPPRFNYPFPSFRLLNSIREIDRKNKTKTYNYIEQLYQFNNKNYKKILSEFKKAYYLKNELEKKKHPHKNNLGFYEMVKINYNIRELKRTFEEYPFVYSYRFIIGCLAMWVFDKNININEKNIFYDYLLNSLGVSEIDKNLLREKIKLSRNLIKECEKLK